MADKVVQVRRGSITDSVFTLQFEPGGIYIGIITFGKILNEDLFQSENREAKKHKGKESSV